MNSGMSDTSRVTQAASQLLSHDGEVEHRRDSPTKPQQMCVQGKKRNPSEIAHIRPNPHGMTLRGKSTNVQTSHGVRRKFWNRYCRGLLLLRRIGSPCQKLHGIQLEKCTQVQTHSCTTTWLGSSPHDNTNISQCSKNTSHPSFQCPRCNRHGREPHHTLTSIVFVLDVDTTCCSFHAIRKLSTARILGQSHCVCNEF